MPVEPSIVSLRGLKDGERDANPRMRLPVAESGAGYSDYEDTSSRVLALNAERDATSGVLHESSLADEVDLNNDAWNKLEWDPEAGLIVLLPTADILWTSDPGASPGHGGLPISADASFPLHVAGAPVGAIWVRRAAPVDTRLRAYAFGSRRMVYSTYNNWDTEAEEVA